MVDTVRKRTCDSLIAIYGLLITCLIIGCGPSQPSSQARKTTSPSNAPLMTVDWANFTYFSSCYQNTEPFHTKNGEAVNDHIHFQVLLPPHYGDLTGDGQAEAVVPYQCSAADAIGVRVFVYTGNASHPRLIGDLPQPNSKGKIANVTKITISHGELNLEGDGYSPNTPHCCPDLLIQTGYRWDGKNFVVTQSTVTKR